MIAKAGIEILINYLEKTTPIFLGGLAFVGSRSVVILPRH